MEHGDLQEKEASLEIDYMQHKKMLENTHQEITKKSAMIGQHQSKNQRAMQQIMELQNFDYQELPEYDRLVGPILCDFNHEVIIYFRFPYRNPI